jgi:hypothetical protein
VLFGLLLSRWRRRCLPLSSNVEPVKKPPLGALAVIGVGEN